MTLVKARSPMINEGLGGLGPMFVQDRGNGPRSAVTVDGDTLYLIRGGGQLHTLAAGDGTLLWEKDLRRDLGEFMSMWDWGYSESPLLDGDLVICTLGGSQGTLAALDKKTGDVVWRSVDWTAASCSWTATSTATGTGAAGYART
jgi:outer membrane protein assembly factor BamB